MTIFSKGLDAKSQRHDVAVAFLISRSQCEISNTKVPLRGNRMSLPKRSWEDYWHVHLAALWLAGSKRVRLVWKICREGLIVRVAPCGYLLNASISHISKHSPLSIFFNSNLSSLIKVNPVWRRPVQQLTLVLLHSPGGARLLRHFVRVWILTIRPAHYVLLLTEIVVCRAGMAWNALILKRGLNFHFNRITKSFYYAQQRRYICFQRMNGYA